MWQSILTRYLGQHYKSLLRDQSDPGAAQQRAFRRLKRNLKGAEVAQACSLQLYNRFEDFVRNTQPSGYESVAPLIRRTLDRNEKGLLFHDDIGFVGRSSGTTARHCKELLFNRATLKSFDDYQIALASVLQHQTDVRILHDQRLTWGSASEIEMTSQGIPCGYVSGFLASRAPRLLRNLSYPTPEVMKLNDMQTRIQLAALQARHRDIRLISGVPTYVINLLQNLKRLWDVEHLNEVWPDLQTMVYSASPIEAYRDQIEELVGNKMTFLGCYVATEGPLGYELNGQSGVYSFHFGDVVYGFRILGEDAGAILPINALRAGDEVELLISGPSGLLNYSMGDCLRILTVSPTVTFEILGRVGQGLNVAAEKVSMRELQKAVASASQKLEVAISHFFVYPGKTPTGQPCYEWTLLLDEAIPLDLDAASAALDRALIELNEDYAENRLQTFFLGAPRVSRMSDRVSQSYFERDSARGQLKMKSAFSSIEHFQEFMNTISVVEGVRA